MRPLTGALIAAAVLVAAVVAGVVWRRRTGNFRFADQRDAVRRVAAVSDPLLAGLGVIPGTPLTLLQFSSVFCGPCRRTRVLCADVAARVPGVRHVEVDAESNLEAVRALDIWRTPTLLLIDAEGRTRLRASGAPSQRQLLAAVAAVLPSTV